MIRNLVLHTAHGSLHGQLDRPDNPRGLILVARAHRLSEDATLASSLEALNFAVLSRPCKIHPGAPANRKF